MCLSCSKVRSPSIPRVKDNTCLTKFAPRLALLIKIGKSRLLRSSSSCDSKSCAVINIGARTLFRSWAIPLAKVPILSNLWARKNCDSNNFF